MEQIATLLEQLAAQLGVGVEYLWPLLVKQTVSRWVGYLIGSSIGIAISYYAFKWGLGTLDDERFKYSDGIPAGLICICSGISMTIFLVMFIRCFMYIDWLFCPEAATVTRLLEMI